MVLSNMNDKDNMLYVYQIKDVEMDENRQVVKTTLSKEYIFWDKGHAIYWRNFTNEYVLKGVLRLLFTDPIRTEILQTAMNQGEVFCFHQHGLVVIWAGEWNHLERIGFLTANFSSNMLAQLYATIDERIRQKAGELIDKQ